MTTLVVQAHPLDDSYNAALLDVVIERERARGEPTVVRLGQGDSFDAASFAGMTRLVFVYPTWWGSLPAMLLGPLNDAIGPWVDGGQPAATSPLRSVESLCAVTSHGSSRLINRLQGEPGLQLWKRTVLKLCAPKARFEWQSLYKLDRLNLAQRQDFLNSLHLWPVRPDSQGVRAPETKLRSDSGSQ